MTKDKGKVIGLAYYSGAGEDFIDHPQIVAISIPPSFQNTFSEAVAAAKMLGADKIVFNHYVAPSDIKFYVEKDSPGKMELFDLEYSIEGCDMAVYSNGDVNFEFQSSHSEDCAFTEFIQGARIATHPDFSLEFDLSNESLPHP